MLGLRAYVNIIRLGIAYRPTRPYILSRRRSSRQ